MTQDGEDHIDAGAALSMRARSAVIRIIIMAFVAAMLWAFGGWSLSLGWWAVYAAIQLLQLRAGAENSRWSYLLAFAAYAVAGLPSCHLWKHNGELGIAAGTMLLCGMLVHLVVSSLGAQRLFWVSATPVMAYLILVPPFAFGVERLEEGLAASACAILIVGYLGVLWRGQQNALAALAEARRRADSARREAEAASQAKTDFLATMSHELRTPMNAVLGAAALLRRTDLSPEQQEHVAMLADSGDVLMQVLNDVLDLSKIEAGRLDIDSTVLDLHEFVRRCAGVWSPRAADKGLFFDLSIAEDLPRHVVGDPTRIGQVVFNLLSNALKFTETGGITLSVERGNGDLIQIAVSDTGIGMTPEVLGRLFCAFEQGDSSISRRFGGTGLGLSISQRLAQMMGGEVAARSEAGTGSAFMLTLPLPAGQPPAETAPHSEGDDADAATGRILVAEDNPSNQRIIELFLRPIGVEVVIVENGEEALKRLADEPFDLVLMDMQMPVMDGLAATRALRASDGPNASIPVIALTANVLEAQKKACLDAGMDGHIAKPIDARLLMSTVMAALSGAAAQSAPPA